MRDTRAALTADVPKNTAASCAGLSLFKQAVGVIVLEREETCHPAGHGDCIRWVDNDNHQRKGGGSFVHTIDGRGGADTSR